MIQRKTTKQQGFTLIELVLAIVFVSTLLISIVLVILHISHIYNRGITLKEVESVGREIAQHLRQDIARHATFPVSGGDSFVDQGADGGRYCLGRYSYVWNSAGKLKSGTQPNKYSGSEASTQIRLVKVIDNNRDLCRLIPAPPGADPTYPAVGYDQATELIGSTSDFLALHKFEIELIKNSGTGGAVYQISYRLGTQDTELIAGDGCKAPGATDSSKRDFSYCAINDFTIIARTSE